MRLFESKIDNNTPADYKPRKIRDVFEGRYVEYKTEKDQNLSMAKYLEEVGAHLHDTINGLQKFGEQKIYVTKKPKFRSATDSNEKRTMPSKSDNIIFMIGIDTNKII